MGGKAEMKEIFNSIRNKASQCSDKACFMPDDAEVITEKRLKQILDEAEAKWEAEVCEWVHGKHYVNCFCRCYGIMAEHDLAIGFKFCPYCGKPIKISEVE